MDIRNFANENSISVDFLKRIRDEFYAEVYKAICFHCRDSGEPEAGADKVTWWHCFKRGEIQYSRAVCKASELRIFFSREYQ